MDQDLYWYKNNYIDINPTNINRVNEFINKLRTKTYDKNVEYKINKIESDYQSKLNEVEHMCSSADEVIKLKCKSSLVILQKELDIIKLLTKYTLQNKNLDHIFFISCLNILLNLSETLRTRIKQKEIIHDKIVDSVKPNEFNISRCSYKFCSYQYNCSYNYNSKTKSLCYQDHYVHNMVSADLKILIEYVKQKYEKNNLFLHNKEIIKTINTLNFVIGHMETELKTKCLYLPESEWDACHVIKNKN
jgi:hypothetical protein